MGLHVDATAYFLFICFVVTCILNRRSQTKSRRRCVFYGGTARVEPATDQGCSGAGTRWNAVPANILQLPRCWDLGLGNTHTDPFNGPLSQNTRVSRYQKGKTNLDFTEARDSE